MDIIYSRKRIKIKKFNKKQKLKLVFTALVFIIFLSCFIYLKAAYPIFIASCKSKANSIAVNLVNEKVNEVMKNYKYDDLVEIHKDSDNKITLVQAKIDKINEIVTLITDDIQREIDREDTTTVYINLGKISGVSILKYLGPTFKIEMERAGKINTKINSEFVSVGINQSIHRIVLKVSCKLSILTPFENVEQIIDTDVIMLETVVIGEVPENYYYYDDINSERVLDAQ